MTYNVDIPYAHEFAAYMLLLNMLQIHVHKVYMKYRGHVMMNKTPEKIANPLNYYANPKDIEQDKSLTIEEKIKILTSWLDDIKLRNIADDENMLNAHGSNDHVATVERLLRKYEHRHMH